MLSTLINELTCGHWTTVVFIELLVYIEPTKKLICTCSPTLVLTKGTKAHQRKVSSARLIVYTAHFIRTGLDFQDRVPVLSVLGLPLDIVRARVKFWSGTDGPKSFTRLNLSVPNQFFWYAYFFHPSRAKRFRPCKWGLKKNIAITHWLHCNRPNIVEGTGNVLPGKLWWNSKTSDLFEEGSLMTDYSVEWLS